MRAVYVCLITTVFVQIIDRTKYSTFSEFFLEFRPFFTVDNLYEYGNRGNSCAEYGPKVYVCVFCKSMLKPFHGRYCAQNLCASLTWRYSDFTTKKKKKSLSTDRYTSRYNVIVDTTKKGNFIKRNHIQIINKSCSQGVQDECRLYLL